VIPVQSNNTSFIEQLNWHSNQATAALARLSSGSKLLAPQDDAAGLAVATRLGAQLLQLNATTNNITNAVSFTQTQSGYLGGTQKVLDRMGELAIRAQDATISDEIRALYNKEYQALKDTFNDARTAQYNGVNLFDGKTLTVAISPENGSVEAGRVDLFTDEINTVTANATNLNTLADAKATLEAVLQASEQTTIGRASLGSTLNALAMASEQVAISRTNLSDALSQIQDTNIAAEVTNLAREQILTQNSIFALKQANLQRANALNLLS
jgi:flagellin